jgi:hypothetical protein
MWDHYKSLLSPANATKVESLSTCISHSELFDWSDIEHGIKLLKNNKALGTNHISAEVLKSLCNESFCKLLAYMFNRIL